MSELEFFLTELLEFSFEIAIGIASIFPIIAQGFTDHLSQLEVYQ